MTTIDTNKIRDDVARAYAWSDLAGAPEPVREAAAEYQRAVIDLDDALVAYEVEVAERRSALDAHHEAVASALRGGKKPPPAKVPSLEEIEVRHGAIIAARQAFVAEAAAVADRVAADHYPQWRAEVLEQLQGAAAAVVQVTIAAADAARDWGAAAQVLARLDRAWAPRTAKLDSAGFLALSERWAQAAAVESTQLGRNVAGYADRLHQLTTDPVIAEYDPAGPMEQYSAGYLATQSPGVREQLLNDAAAK